MIQLNPTQVTSALKALFSPTEPAGIRCFAVLEGSIAGQILTDNADSPTWSVVREAMFGTTYFGGAIDSTLLSEVIITLRRAGDVVIGLWHDDERSHLLPPNPEYDGIALNYTDRPLNEGLDAYLQVPEGCTIRRVDAELFERSVDRDMNILACGGKEKALESLIGFYLMRGDEILCEASTGPAVMGIREAGVMTYEAHRGHGYATIACAHLIRFCEQAGYQTLWNTAKQNLGSNALARKLGYRKAQEYRVIAWFKSEV
jgi:RimJ/RimL family protein N-acetyltransferase